MKVKELFELLTPACDPEIGVYDYKTNEAVTYNCKKLVNQIIQGEQNG